MNEDQIEAVESLKNAVGVRVYSGRKGCACGCRGMYGDSPAAIKRVRNKMIKAAEEGDGVLKQDAYGFFWLDKLTSDRTYTFYLSL